MQALRFSRVRPTGREVRTVVPAKRLCIFTHQGKRRTARLGCAATYVVRLMQSGWTSTLAR